MGEENKYHPKFTPGTMMEAPEDHSFADDEGDDEINEEAGAHQEKLEQAEEDHWQWIAGRIDDIGTELASSSLTQEERGKLEKERELLIKHLDDRGDNVTKEIEKYLDGQTN